jgi:hypothetical protein
MPSHFLEYAPEHIPAKLNVSTINTKNSGEFIATTLYSH